MKTVFGYEKFATTLTWLKNGQVITVESDRTTKGKSVRTLKRDYSTLGGQEWTLMYAD